MTKKGTKKAPGITGARTVCQLNPIRYEIRLLYLGHKRVIHSHGKYTCMFKLDRGSSQSALDDLPVVIENRVRRTAKVPTESDAAALKAATPTGVPVDVKRPELGVGDATNPPGDERFRVVITDNHAVPESEMTQPGRPGLHLGARRNVIGEGPLGDKYSKPEVYRDPFIEGPKMSWMPDIESAVPFRIIVRKFCGGSQVSLTRKLSVVLAVKDPVGDPDGNTGPAQRFLRDFFNEQNQSRQVPNPGDDNAAVIYGGHRNPGRPPGVRAAEVLKAAPVLPKIAAFGPSRYAGMWEGPSTASPQVEIDELTEAAPFGESDIRVPLFHGDDIRTKADLERADLPTIGIADVVWRAKPIGGDNYRFLIRLVDENGNDLRDTDENGRAVIVADDRRRPIEKPRAYVTGRFVIWRRLCMRLVIYANNLTPADLDWDLIKTTYARSFIEVAVAKPQDRRVHASLSRAEWRAALESEPTLNDPSDPDPNFAKDEYFTKDRYDNSFIPRFLVPSFGARHLATMTKKLVKQFCRRIGTGVPYESAHRLQEYPQGLFVLFCKTDSALIGQDGGYIGDRMFWVVWRRNRFSKQATARANYSNTFMHEIGHALFLRHSFTTRGNKETFRYVPGDPGEIALLDSAYNASPHDHDQQGALECLMSYFSPRDAAPCGMCSLTLRFYDKVKLRETHRKRILAGLMKAVIVAETTTRVREGGRSATVPLLTEEFKRLRVGQTLPLLGLGRLQHELQAPSATTACRVNLTNFHDPPEQCWKKLSGTGEVEFSLAPKARFADRMGITGRKRGPVAIRFQIPGSDVFAEKKLTVE